MSIYSEYPDDLPARSWTTTPKHVSPLEKANAEVVLDAVRARIESRKIEAHQITSFGRPMAKAERARILRGDYDNFSFRRACLIADSIGIKVGVTIK